MPDDKNTSTTQVEKQEADTSNMSTEDVFWTDWQETKTYWKRYHRIWDYDYLFYKSVLTYNNLYGTDYLNAFGMQIFVPRTFQTVESIAAQLNSRKTEFIVEGEGLIDSFVAPYFQKMDNIEWKRSKAETEKADATKDALIFGNGYIFNPYVDNTVERHFPKTVSEELAGDFQDPEDGKPQEDTVDVKKPIEWEKKMMTYYRGMKPRRLNPYYVFPDPAARDDSDWQFCYVYSIMRVDKLRSFVVSKGWMTQVEANEKINPNLSVEWFDSIRDTIDSLYDTEITPWTRTDNYNRRRSTSSASKQKYLRNMVAIVERFEEDLYEVRLDGSKIELHKDYNIYPHKKIPIIPLWDYKVNDEFPGMGEPQVIRWQQIEENKIHNLTMNAMLLSIVQRYAINSSLLQDETDLSFQNPFKPIRLKNLPGISVNQAIMPMAQPDVKQTPFELMALVKDTIQQTTGATDFIVGASQDKNDTLGQSRGLAMATSSRISEKARGIDEGATVKIVEQWHPCYFYFYDEEMEFRLTGEKKYVMYLPLDRGVDNEDPAKVAVAIEKLNGKIPNGVTGQTLVQVYKNAGYEEVIFRSDIVGNCTVTVKISDVDVDNQKEVGEGMQALKLMDEINATNAQNPAIEKFDTFKLGKDILKKIPMTSNVDQYVQGQNKPAFATMPTGTAELTALPTAGGAPAEVAPVGMPTGAVV